MFLPVPADRGFILLISLGPEAVVDKSLQRATDETISLAHATSMLADVLSQPIPTKLD